MAQADNKPCPVCSSSTILPTMDVCSACVPKVTREVERDLSGPLRAFMAAHAAFDQWLVEHGRT